MKADPVGAEMSNFALHRRAEQVPLGAATEDGIPVAVMVNVEVNSRLTQNPGQIRFCSRN
jgi:hypothetical protein